MKKFFMKKEIFSISFFGFIILFFVLNIFRVDTMKDMVKEVRKEISVRDIWASGNIHYLIEDVIKEEALKKVNLKEIHGLFYKLLGKKEFGNLYYVKGKDEMMYYGSLIQEKGDMLVYAKRVKRAMEEAEKKNAKTLFVMQPSKIIYGLSDIGEDIE